MGREKEQKGQTALLDYYGLVDEGIVFLWPGIFLAGWEVVGQDMDSLSSAESWQISCQVAGALKLGHGWTVQSDVIRAKYQEYSEASPNWPDRISYLIDEERRSRFNWQGDGAYRASRYFVTVSYEPRMKGTRRAARAVFMNEEGTGGPNQEALSHFKKSLIDIELKLRSQMSFIRRLQSYKKTVGVKSQTCDELLQHVRHCITGDDFPFALPTDPSHLNELLNQYLATDDFTGGAEPELGDPLNELLPGRRIAVVSIDMFPDESHAGIMRELDGIGHDFRFTCQAQIMDEFEAQESHKANKGRWRGKKQPASKKLLPIGGVTEASDIDTVAVGLELDAANAMRAAEYGQETFVRFSAKAIIMHADAAKLKEAVEAIASTVKLRCGFSCRIETINAVAAWLSSFPGQHYKEPRLFLINTANMADMMPLSAPFRGLQYNPSKYFPPQSPPLAYAVTSGGTPFRYHTHVQDVGHELVIGPIGAGKSVYLGLKAAQAFRYQGAKVYVFDKKRSMYTLCKAMGGAHYDISPNNSERLCPLAELRTPVDRDWAARCVELLLELNGLSVNHKERNDIRETLRLLSEQPESGRSLTDFAMAVQSQTVKEAIKVYLNGLLDGDRDDLELNRFCVFEMDELYNLDRKVMNGALFTIFNKIRRQLDSANPTFVMVDEFREALDHPMAAKEFGVFLDEGRKNNLAVTLVLQDLAKALASPLKQSILQETFSKMCLPNPHALLEARAHYEMLGCDYRDCELIAQARMKSDYYTMSPNGKRLISFDLQQVSLAFLANSSDQDQREVRRLIQRDGDAWPAEWLRQRGLFDWARLFESLKEERKGLAVCA